MEKTDDLIVALATPDTVSAIAVVRLSGDGSASLVEKLMDLEPGRLKGARRVVGDFADIDHLVALSWPLGKSYTGEEMVDLMCHGSPGTPAMIVALLERHGARIAMPGEFTRRAWHNGKLNSLDVLGLFAKFQSTHVHDDIDYAAEFSEITSALEAFIEFDDDHETNDVESFSSLLESLLLKTQNLAQRVRQTELLPRVIVMGPVNAGKSTLFNHLAGRTAAVVSPLPGTTRDGLSVTVHVSGRNVEILDSAGFGGEALDSEALDILLSTLKPSDRILWLDPIASEPPVFLTKKHKTLLLRSKCDLCDSSPKDGWFQLSTVTGTGLADVFAFISNQDSSSSSWRLDRISSLIQKTIDAVAGGDIALAAQILSEIHYEAEMTINSGDAVERALERFCVGK